MIKIGPKTRRTSETSEAVVTFDAPQERRRPRLSAEDAAARMDELRSELEALQAHSDSRVDLKAIFDSTAKAKASAANENSAAIAPAKSGLLSRIFRP